LHVVRALLYGTAALAVAALSSPDALRCVVASSASALFEATPWALAGIFVARFAHRHHYAVAYLGCGCADGPSARSLPVTAATWVLFGPLVASLRFLSAVGIGLLLRRARGRECDARAAPNLLCDLARVLPAAMAAGAAIAFGSRLDPARLGRPAEILLGALVGFAAAPCGLGVVALAGALAARAPLVAAAFLCVAGIVDVRAFAAAFARSGTGHDCFAYALLATALAVVAARHGDALVHPAIALALGPCAIAAIALALLHRARSSPPARLAPGLMLAGALVGAPAPQYHATETTLTDVFAGERLTFTGTLTRDGRQSALVRYAITCCRADAAPVAIRLEQAPRYPAGTWLRVEGAIESSGGDMLLLPQRIQPIAPPVDPFIYR
jgi:hypothetical protein